MNINLVTQDILLEFVQKFFKQRHTCISRSFTVAFAYFYTLNIHSYDRVFDSIIFFCDDNYEKKLDKIFKNQQLDFDLLYKINELIDDLIDNQLLEVSLYPPKILNNGINYISTMGKYNQYFEIEKEDNIYNYRMNMNMGTYIEDYFKRKRLILLENCQLLEKIEHKERFREYWIPKARWSDLEGESTLEIQTFFSYIVLIELFSYRHFSVAVVQKNIYKLNSNYERYLPPAPWRKTNTKIGHDNTEFSNELAKKIYHYYFNEGKFMSHFNDEKAICVPEDLIKIHEQAHLELNDNLFSD